MSAAVLHDVDDDLAFTVALRARAAQSRRALVVAITPPASRPSVVWDVLRAMGKRADLLGSATPNWADAETWLRAYASTNLSVLRAHTLRTCFKIRAAR
jgi:hypothetical protein